MNSREAQAQFESAVRDLRSMLAPGERAVNELRALLRRPMEAEALVNRAAAGGTGAGDDVKARVVSALHSGREGELLSHLPWPYVVAIAGPPGTVVTQTVEWLSHPVYWVRLRAAELLQNAAKNDFAVGIPAPLIPELRRSVAESLLAACVHPDNEARWFAIDALSRIPTATLMQAGLAVSFVKRLEDALRDPAPEVRWIAARGLTLYQWGDWRGVLRLALEHEPVEWVRRIAQNPVGLAKWDSSAQRCEVCGRLAPDDLLHLFSVYSVYACTDYMMMIGCSDLLVLGAAAPLPPRSPFDLTEWSAVQVCQRREWIGFIREKRRSGAKWSEARLICRRCVGALGFSPADIELARSRCQAHLLGNAVPPVCDPQGTQLKREVEGNCFVCTVVFGAASAGEVRCYREFRDRRLSRCALGRQVIRFYETIGPQLATEVGQHPRLKRIARGLLTALVPVVTALTPRQTRPAERDQRPSARPS